MTVRVFLGNAPDVLRQLPLGHYHTIVTSPPFLWARDYQTPPVAWPDGWVGELGQEPQPEQFVAHLVGVMAECWRVLRDDGTLWVNLGTSAFNDAGGQNGSAERRGGGRGISPKAVAANAGLGRTKRVKHEYLKQLDLVDVPGLFANAMQRAGWIWRQDITWPKSSPLPESVEGSRWERHMRKVSKGTTKDDGTKQATYPQRQVAGFNERYFAGTGKAKWEPCPGCERCQHAGHPERDGLVLRRGNGRPTKSTERILLFIKRSEAFYDTEAVREPVSEATLADGRRRRGQRGTKGETAAVDGNCGFDPTRGRNLRNWWPLKVENLQGEHYAAFPSELPATCIRAGTSERGCCPACGAPWARLLEHVKVDERPKVHRKYAPLTGTGNHGTSGFDGNGMRYDADYAVVTTTRDWLPTCDCPAAPPVPCRVLDPFGGSGTTGLAADRLGRDCDLIDLNPEYTALQARRLTNDAPLLMQVEVVP